MAFLYRKQRRKEPEDEPSDKAKFFAANMGNWAGLGLSGVVLTTRDPPDIHGMMLGHDNKGRYFQVSGFCVDEKLDKVSAIKVMSQGLLDRVVALGCRSLVHYVPIQEWEEAKLFKDAGFNLVKKLELINPQTEVELEIYVFVLGSTQIQVEGDDGEETAGIRGGPDIEGGPSPQLMPGS